ncbi:hypothetical protein RRG08_061483 [Elysia crispata]|uniref:Uncharacterized protein n=1 Tax=Elysia crispata TaxID=231223 RepID=A0AAE1CXE4_9GAST|nr:hypothetical protein RRG08_061483 [Elysia crispata]
MGSDKPLVLSHVSEDAAAAKYDDNEEEDIVEVPRTEEERLLKQQLIALFDTLTLNTDESISIASTIIRFFETQRSVVWSVVTDITKQQYYMNNNFYDSWLVSRDAKHIQADINDKDYTEITVKAYNKFIEELDKLDLGKPNTFVYQQKQLMDPVKVIKTPFNSQRDAMANHIRWINTVSTNIRDCIKVVEKCLEYEDMEDSLKDLVIEYKQSFECECNLITHQGFQWGISMK